MVVTFLWSEKEVIAMNNKELITEAVKLPSAKRFAVIDELLYSLDRLDSELDRI